MITVLHWPRWLRDDPSFVDNHVIRELGVHKSVNGVLDFPQIDCLYGLQLLVSGDFISSVTNESDETSNENVSETDITRIQKNFLSAFEDVDSQDVDAITLANGLDKSGRIHRGETIVLSRMLSTLRLQDRVIL